MSGHRDLPPPGLPPAVAGQLGWLRHATIPPDRITVLETSALRHNTSTWMSASTGVRFAHMPRRKVISQSSCVFVGRIRKWARSLSGCAIRLGCTRDVTTCATPKLTKLADSRGNPPKLRRWQVGQMASNPYETPVDVENEAGRNSQPPMPSRSNPTQQRRDKLANVLAILGGVVMVLSAFFRLSYGPWGTPISYYSLITHNLSFAGWPILLSAWPIVLGLLEVGGGFSRLRGWNVAWQALLIGGLLLTVAGVYSIYVSTFPLIVVLICVTLACILRTPRWTRLSLLRIIGAACVLIETFPREIDLPLSDLFVIYGPGYWLLAAGALIVGGTALLSRSTPQSVAWTF